MDLTGQTYGRWKVLHEVDKCGRKRHWFCQCSCGTKKDVRQDMLSSGVSQSCGCLMREIAATLGKRVRVRMDLTGEVYGRYTVIRESEAQNGMRRWLCKCVCGTEKLVFQTSLRGGDTRSCGCLARERSSARKCFPMLGKTFGRLVVKSQAPDGPNQQRYWGCECECGGLIKVSTSGLRSGNNSSCGCLAKEGNNLRHGRAKTPEWIAWVAMRQRCENPKVHNYVRYGGRGIKVCQRWARFENFFADMGKRPAGSSIDRIRNSGNYSPSNCRWATAKQQARNRRSNRILAYQGQEHCLATWCEKLGLPYHLARDRLARGWDVARAFTGGG